MSTGGEILNFNSSVLAKISSMARTLAVAWQRCQQPGESSLTGLHDPAKKVPKYDGHPI